MKTYTKLMCKYAAGFFQNASENTIYLHLPGLHAGGAGAVTPALVARGAPLPRDAHAQRHSMGVFAAAEPGGLLGGAAARLHHVPRAQQDQLLREECNEDLAIARSVRVLWVPGRAAAGHCARRGGRAGGGGGGAGAGAGGAELLFCLSGLVGAYLVWGLLQEKIMTQKYVLADGSSVQFADSQFLVFTNRLSALLLAAAALLYKGVPLAAAPLYKFSYCSVSNIVSAWSQYEALKYVGFPTQVLSKSCKVVPVMLMGTLVSRTSYPLADYVSAGFISAGMLAFLTATDQDAVSTSTTASGLILLALYMASDSFTSNWQQRLYHQYKLTPMQMMYGVNLYSCLLTGAAMYNRAGGLSEEQWRLLQHPMFLCDVAVLALASALGQLLIYRTIARFGAALFTVIMTVRQAISILLSCLVYGHRIAPWGVLGVAVVFAAALSRVYRRRATPRPA
ncbi:unnamed protein product [Plutella xylostella]|uniref:Adenosine 3'-phospho 5'-phosphosulfate transporter 1 n=1 Tax=Plutella xylostella TaxID=51655 RepID=A0A8S4G822_PLUXY|nr:unnamed protein product [Plutella xylostella]